MLYTSLAVIEVEYKLGLEYTKYTTHLTITGELWGVLEGISEENWPGYKGTTLYMYNVYVINDQQSLQDV